MSKALNMKTVRLLLLSLIFIFSTACVLNDEGTIMDESDSTHSSSDYDSYDSYDDDEYYDEGSDCDIECAALIFIFLGGI